MALYYPPLDWFTTEKIWRNLIRRARESPTKVECNSDALVKFACGLFEDQNKSSSTVGPAWNGRQIRNAFQSAIALARNENTKPDASVLVESRHFKTVAEVSNEFNNYIWRVNKGRTDADYAREVGSRYDEFSRTSFAQGSAQRQPHQFSPPVQTPMPMRQATPSVNQFQSFSPPQTMYQQPAYATTTGSPYNPNQPTALYNNAQPPPQFSLSPAVPAYGTQQPQYPQQLQGPPAQQHQAPHMPAGQQFQSPQAPQAQQYQAPQVPSGQQFQSSQAPLAQQYQTAQPQAGYALQVQPGAPTSYVPTGVAEQAPVT